MLSGLGVPAERSTAATALARSLGAWDALLFILDPELDVLLPAPGLPQTLPPGSEWPQFLERCRPGEWVSGELPAFKRGSVYTSRAVTAPDGTVLVLLGGSPRREDVQAILQLLPLVGSTIRGEFTARAAEGHAAAAREAARQARGLAESLDAVRRQLQSALRTAQQAERQKDDFLAMLAHELRNPLAPILNAISVLQQRGSEDPVAARHYRIIDRQARQLTHLVDDLLDVSRITHGKVELQKEYFPLTRAVDHAAEMSRPLLDERRHAFTLIVPEASPWVYGDCVRLTQVLSNLLTNAARYTEPGGTITLAVSEEDSQAVVRVRDNGRGIAPEMLPRVFDLFTQVNPSLDRRQGGLGIGLTLVRRLVEMHHGEVSACSPGLGAGSEFTVRLPSAPALALSTTDALEAPAEPTGPPPPGRRILIVDDNRDAAETLADLLEVWGELPELAFDGPAALDAVRRRTPEVVLLDIGLPGWSGYEVADRLRKQLLFDGLLIALTGYGQSADRCRALDSGFDEHLTKPVDPQHLRSLLNRQPRHSPNAGP